MESTPAINVGSTGESNVGREYRGMDFKDYRGMDKEYSGIVKNEEKYTIFHGCMLLILINMNLLTQIRSHARGRNVLKQFPFLLK